MDHRLKWWIDMVFEMYTPYNCDIDARAMPYELEPITALHICESYWYYWCSMLTIAKPWTWVPYHSMDQSSIRHTTHIKRMALLFDHGSFRSPFPNHKLLSLKDIWMQGTSYSVRIFFIYEKILFEPNGPLETPSTTMMCLVWNLILF